MSSCRVDCQKKQITPTKTNIFAQYVVRVRRNMHVCLCMSPFGRDVPGAIAAVPLFSELFYDRLVHGVAGRSFGS